jgi:adenylate kinase family enzyme
MKRVTIVGSGGAGKSTLARELGEITELPVIHLDREHWGPGWAEPDRDEWARTVESLITPELWIIDGNYGGTMKARFDRADTFIFLDFSRWLCVFRVIKRAVVYRDRARPDMTPGCNEKLDPKFLRWIWEYPASRRPGIMEMLSEARTDGKQVIVLHNPRQVERFLGRMTEGAASSRALAG